MSIHANNMYFNYSEVELIIKRSNVRIAKKGIRVLGISESFVKQKTKRSILTGVVMRADGIIDGFGIYTTTVGGLDATKSVISLYENLKRKDVNVIFLNGCIISWFNVIDLKKVYEKVGLPLICVTYEESEGLEKYFKEYFKDWEERFDIYLRNGERERIEIKTGKTVFTRSIGLEKDEVKRILDKFTLNGAISEPLRISRLLANSILKNLYLVRKSYD
jgi:endonuclease V-like protein UPF0215 family